VNVRVTDDIADIPAKEGALFCHASKTGYEGSLRRLSLDGLVFQTLTIRSKSGIGNGRSRTALTKLNMALFAPIPTVSVSRSNSVRPGA
jgi:hypothetical protein